MPKKTNTAKVPRRPLRSALQELPEVGGILHLEHFNFEVFEHDMVTTFFMNGLGFTRDPYKRADETNIGINIGMQQFHLPRRGNPTPPFQGIVGLIIPEARLIKARLDRLRRLGKFDDTPYSYKVERGVPMVTSPFGVRLRLHAAGTLPFLRPLGIAYVDLFVPPGTAEAIANFYRVVMEAPVTVLRSGKLKTATINMGAYQFVNFIEKEMDDYNLYNFHISYYVSRYNEIRARVAKQGSMVSDGIGQNFFFDDIFDPKSDQMIFRFQQEPRSVYHEDFMRPLINRWPIDNEPFSHQADVMRDLARDEGLDFKTA